MNRLSKLLHEWQEWSRSADQSEDGWESSFPRWSELIEAALERMKSPPDREALELIARCWAMSEEDETLLDKVRSQNRVFWPFMKSLSTFEDARVRWQIYAAVTREDEEGLALVRFGIKDKDPYVQRRALLSLARLHAPESANLAKELCKHADPYLRQVSLMLAYNAGDSGLVEAIKSQLENDPVEHVRVFLTRGQYV